LKNRDRHAASPSPWPKLFRQHVDRHKNPRLAINTIRASFEDRDPRGLFEALRGNAMFRQSVAISPEPKKFSKLWDFTQLRDRGLLADLQWAAEAINLFADILLDFLPIEQRFEDAYLMADWDRCLTLLDDLESRHGLSLWLISRRITVLRRRGATSEDDYATNLIATATEGTIITWLVYMMSYRMDPNVTPASYVRIIENSLRNAEVPKAISSYLHYYTLNKPPRCPEDCANIVAMSETAPMIDRYLAVLDACQFVTCYHEADSAERTLVSKIASRLFERLGDDRLAVLYQVNVQEMAQEIVSRVSSLEADLYTAGDYSATVASLSSRLSESPGLTSLYSLLARSSVRCSLQPSLPEPISELVRSIAAVHDFSEEEDVGLIRLSREELAGAHRALCATIRCLISGRAADPTESHLDAAMEALNCTTLTPLHLRNLPVPDRRTLLRLAQEAHPHSIALELQGAVLEFGTCAFPISLRDRLPPDRAALYTARAFLRLSDLTAAVDLLESLEKESLASVANDARRELYRAFIKAGRYSDALRLVARAYRQNERLHVIFELAPLLDAIEQSEGGPPFDDISLSIGYHILNRFGGAPRVGVQADAAEEFVLSQGVDLPSKLDIAALEPNEELLPIYLDQVCVPAILDKFMAIETVNQVEIERLGICRVLSEIDTSNRQRYLEEIREITRRRVVRERFEQVERTKIYFDTDGVKRQAEKTLRDAYQRFAVANIDDVNSSERLEIVRHVQKILSEVKTDGYKIHFPDLPANESDQIFDRLVNEIMQLLVSSQEYGLEAYLSTRVRHGTMGNQLRSAFELQSLLTQRDNGQYQPDRHWPDALGLESYLGGTWLADRLAKFSESLDGLIEDLIRRRVQVRAESTPEGLFVFPAFNYDLLKLQAEITPDTSFDTFMDKVIESFWSILEYALVQVRQYIENDFADAVFALTDELERDVVRELAKCNTSPLRDAIAAARTQMSVNLANVANWFTLARDMERPDYEFGIAVEVATESIRVCHPSLDVILKRPDMVSFECRGKTLESLVYVLFTALDNALKHCGFSDRAPQLTLETSLEGNWLQLRLVNSCAPISNINDENVRLSALHERLEGGNEVRDLATIEGGSGYAKIIRILRHDLLARYSLEFGYRNSTEYAVTIGVDAKAIVK
jgi:tetratricopeptide (TPR) repeat protein